MPNFDDPAKENWPSLPNHWWDDNDPAELVDFPVADIWLRDYHEKGMTPRCPEPNAHVQLNELSDRVERLETAIRARRRQQPASRLVYQAPPVMRQELERPAAPKNKKATKGTG